MKNMLSNGATKKIHTIFKVYAKVDNMGVLAQILLQIGMDMLDNIFIYDIIKF